MEPLLAWAFLSVVVERIVEMFSNLFPFVDNIHIKEFDIKKGLALILGGLFAYGADLDFFQMVNIEFNILYVGQGVSAIFIMAGSNYIHDIIAALNRKKEEQQIVLVEVEKE